MLFAGREVRIEKNCANTRGSVSSEYPNTEKRVENTMDIGVFSDRTQGVWIANETKEKIILSSHSKQKVSSI